MKIDAIRLTTIHWEGIPAIASPGAEGNSRARCVENGNIRLRMVEYNAGYESDHWCEKGHAGYVLSGSVLLESAAGDALMLGAGMGFLVGDGADPHRVRSREGALLFIVD